MPMYFSARPHARCPECGSLERHRLDWLFLKEETDLFNGRQKRLLHVAPEEIFEKKFRALPGIVYVSVDLASPRAMVRADVTCLPFEDESFEIIYCSHVLEHVPNDRRAIKEFYRVLKLGGWGLLQVPITSHRTFEDPTITSPIERARVFGQYDHVRRYGPDYKARLEESGFKVKVISAGELIKKEEDFYRMGLDRKGLIFYCLKDSLD